MPRGEPRERRTIQGVECLCCSACGTWLPIGEFYKHVRADGVAKVHSWCKGCMISQRAAKRASRAGTDARARARPAPVPLAIARAVEGAAAGFLRMGAPRPGVTLAPMVSALGATP